MRPVRRALATWAATPTVKASTRSDGRLTLVGPAQAGVVHGLGHHPLDAGEVGRGERRQAHLVVPGAAEPLLDHGADLVGRSLPDRAGDHPGLAEPAAAGAAPEHLDREPVVHHLGQRDQLVLRVGPLAEVGDGPLDHLGRDLRIAGGDADQGRPVVGDLVHGRHVDALDRGQAAQHVLAAPSVRPDAVHSRTTSVISDTTSSPSPMTKKSTYSASGSGLNVAWPPAPISGCCGAAVLVAHRHAGQVHAAEQVGVDELGRQVERDDVELAGRTVAVDREQRQAVAAQLGLQVRPGRVGPLGHRVVALVQDLVEDLQALVGQPDLVRVRVDQQPRHLARAVGGDDGPVLAADVAGGLLHLGQQWFEPGPERHDPSMLARGPHRGLVIRITTAAGRRSGPGRSWRRRRSSTNRRRR